MGDVLWIEPIICEIAKKYKKVIVVSRFNELFENYQAENIVFKYDLSFFEKLLYHFERILNINVLFINLELAYENNTKTHFLHAYQEKSKLPIKNVYPNLFLKVNEKEAYKYYGKYVVLHLNAFAPKNYRKIFGINWDGIIQNLMQKGYKIVVIGKNDSIQTACMEFNGNIRELVSLIYNCNLFIGLDSGPSHIAASLNKPAIIFFGAVNPLFRHFKDLRDNIIIMQSACEFSGCYHEVTNTIYGTTCQLVGDNGIPKCSIHSTENLLKNIELLLN